MSTPSDHWNWIDARAKLTDCFQNHACDSTRNTELPLRLLDLQAYPEHPERIRVVATSEILTTPGKNVQYAALSYCWGSTAAFTTTPATLQSRLDGFAVSKMPLTLRDTVTAVRQLGIRYLWIDALCILQGGRDNATALADWQYEAGRMHLIYGNSSLCIVAAGASRSEDGLMHKNPVLLEDVEVAYWIKRGKVPIGRETISSRAWCLQEWLLANRLLVFASTEVYFICDKNSIDASDPDYSFRFPKSREDTLERDGAATSRYTSWQTVAMNLCGRDMTVSSDKLPALSGLAQRYAKVMGYRADDYLAGLWRATLITDLLWTREEGDSSISATPDHLKTGRRRDRAPSWSWASIDGSIMYLSVTGGRIPQSIRVEDCRVTTPGGQQSDPFGLIHSGSLTISCPYMELWAKPMTEESGQLYYQLFNDDGAFISLLTIDDPSEMKNPVADDELNKAVGTPTDLFETIAADPRGIRVFCLGLMVEQKSRRRDGKLVWGGIAVRRIKGYDSYARIGNFCTEFEAYLEARFRIV